jgi:hypothetical protein
MAELARLGGHKEANAADDHFDPASLNKMVD